MQCWTFLKDKNNEPEPKKPAVIKMTFPIHSPEERNWKFSVKTQDLLPTEKVFITGNAACLGEWNMKKMIGLSYVKENVWTVTIVIPAQIEIKYRYVICNVIDEPEKIIIQKWETHIEPRILETDIKHPFLDMFGNYKNKIKVEKGWLTCQSILQLKMDNNPLKLKNWYVGRMVNIKVTPVKLTFNNEMHHDESSHSTDTLDITVPKSIHIKVCTLNNDPLLCIPHPQEQFGREYNNNDVLLFNIECLKPEELAYLVDIYSYSSRASLEEPPCHVGYAYLMPNMLNKSIGCVELPITCNVKHRVLGTILINYIIIKPMADNTKLCNFKVSYSKHWDPAWTGLEVGHRGLGASFKNREGNPIRENTIASLKKAAESGADMLEFDVQLSKDLVPVIYHDFHVYISMKRKKELTFSGMLELPVKDLSLENLQKLKIYHLTEGQAHEAVFENDELEEHQPFPTLEQALKTIDINVGFNVELKWTMEMEDGTFELNNPFDMNLYVDKVLKVVIRNAGQRRIVFSCFNPDICTMVRCKQNKYPVMFLTNGITEKYKPYRDPRCLTIPAAIKHAISADILGIVVHTEDLLRDPTQVDLVKNAGLVIFCWGDDNNNKETIRKLKGLGLHAVIYDKIDVYTTKEVQQSIFLVDAREHEREILSLVDLQCKSAENEMSMAKNEERHFDPEVRFNIVQTSTATSLESLVSSTDISDQLKDKAFKKTPASCMSDSESDLNLDSKRSRKYE